MNMIEMMEVSTSDKGTIKNIPLTPRKPGSRKIKGIMKKITLEVARKILILFLPIAWKYIADITFIPAKGKAYITSLKPWLVILKS